jgi:hypothetical protein
MAVSHTVTVKKLMNTTGFLFGGKKNIQNTKTNTNPKKKKKKKTILTNSTTQPKCWQVEQPPNKERNYGVREQLQDFWENNKTVKRRTTSPKPIRHCQVVSSIAHSLHLQRTCGVYPRITRLLLHHSLFFFWALFQVSQISVNKTPPKKKRRKHQKKTQTKFETFW